jgi:hypothetical protein
LNGRADFSGNIKVPPPYRLSIPTAPTGHHAIAQGANPGRNIHFNHRTHGLAMGYRILPRWGGLLSVSPVPWRCHGLSHLARWGISSGFIREIVLLIPTAPTGHHAIAQGANPGHPSLRSSALKGRNPVVRMAAPPHPAPSGRNIHVNHRTHGLAMGYRILPRWGGLLICITGPMALPWAITFGPVGA